MGWILSQKVKSDGILVGLVTNSSFSRQPSQYVHSLVSSSIRVSLTVVNAIPTAKIILLAKKKCSGEFRSRITRAITKRQYRNEEPRSYSVS